MSSLCCGVLFPFLSEDGDGMSWAAGEGHRPSRELMCLHLWPVPWTHRAVTCDNPFSPHFITGIKAM